MQEQQIEQIKNALREMMQLIIARGQPLSEEMKISLAQAMEHAAQRISQLRQEQRKEEQGTTELPPIEEVEAEQAAVANEVTPQEEAAPQAPSEPIPPLDDAPYESSNISGFKYDPKSQKLIIRFQGKYPQKNSGAIYSYEGVPQNIFDVFRRGAVVPKTSGKNRWHTWRRGISPSHGASMYALIREGGYKFRKLR